MITGNVKQFTLTATQEERIADLQRDSFNGACQDMGVNPSQFQDFLLMVSKEKIRRAIDQVSKANPHVDAGTVSANDPLLSAPDWWSFKGMQLTLDAQRVFDHMMSCADKLPIDHAYLQRTARALGISDQEHDDSQFLLCFLQAIPRVCLYGVKFNAFVDPTLDGSLPYVGVYEHLISSCEAFLELVLKQVLWHDSARESAEFVDHDECGRRGTDRIFIEALSTCLNCAMQKRDAMLLDEGLALSTGEPQLQFPLVMALGGSAEFAWYHEYGHLLRGHLERPSCQQLEFEADEFALMVLSLTQYGGKASDVVSWWHVMGGVSVLLLLGIVEKILGQGPSMSHPLGVERIASFLSHMSGSAAELFVRYICCTNEVCRATLKHYWGLDVDMSDEVIDCLLARVRRGTDGQRPNSKKTPKGVEPSHPGDAATRVAPDA